MDECDKFSKILTPDDLSIDLKEGETVYEYANNLCAKDSSSLVSDLPLYKVTKIEIASESKDGSDPAIFINKVNKGQQICISTANAR